MFTPGGQIDHLTFAGLRGGKGGGSDNTALLEYMMQNQGNTATTYTDPVDSTVYTTPSDLNAHIAAREAASTAASDTAATTAAQTAADKEAAFQASKSAATQAAINSAMAEFRRQGVDPNAYLASDITPTVNQYASTIQDLDPNPASAFSSTLGSDIVNSVLSGKRQSNVDLLNQTFTPNYSTNALTYDATQPYVNTIINQQFDPLAAGLKNASLRGTLNDQGYQGALSALAAKKAAATSTVNALAQGVINTDRSTLDDYLSGARTGIGNLSLAASNAFDPTMYTDQAKNLVSSDLSNLGGDITSKVGDTQFANLSDLMNAGGAYQGATNPQATGQQGMSDAGTSPTVISQQQQAQRRGLGTQGTF
jgi:hypothetical protein